LVPLFIAVPTTDYYSALSAPTSFQWLLLVPSRGSDLACPHFASITFSNNPLRGLGHLFDQFSTFFNYCRTVFIWFRFVVGELIPFSFFGLPTFSSFQLRSKKDPPYLIRKKKLSNHIFHYRTARYDSLNW
jgi:hypothetical protein